MTHRIAQPARLALILPSALAGCIATVATRDFIYSPKGDVEHVIVGPPVCRKLDDLQTQQAALALANRALDAFDGEENAREGRKVMKNHSFGQCGRWVRVEYAADPGVATGVVLVDVDLRRELAVNRLDLNELAFHE